MIEPREIQTNFIKATYEVSIKHSKQPIVELEKEQEWELLDYAREVPQGIQDELEWLLSDDAALDQYFETWHKSEQMLKQKTKHSH
ncbi:hypothetical protein M7775_07960 [Sporomusa sphaeroides DSM 2875]|uniref:hypothetical protein n=1 Tax=Sporomusa sphaeroides TaxID=47679 RepID=UPI00202F04CE|nr:hypothetical protein [Sporomusa sphaeroides]MCM0758504.1 hypothetical protein [Sporomusa sphaeroides DSM 2875]